MKIALFTDSFLPGIGGTENVVSRLATEYSKNHQVIVFAPGYHREFDESKLPYKIVRTKSVGVSRNDFWALPSITGEVKKTLDDFKPDIIHSHTFGMMAGYANKYGKKHNIPVICTAHTKFRYCYKYYLKFDLFADILLKHVIKRPQNADKVTAVSYSMIPELKKYGLKNKDVLVIQNGNDSFPKQNIQPKPENKKFVILYVGLIIDYKNVGFSIKALSELKKKNDNFIFYMVGNGPDERKYRRMINKLGLQDNVVMTGAITDRIKLVEMFRNADLLLFTSIFDNGGLVVLEAADMETPSLVLENTGASERISDGETGFVAKNDVASVANKIEYLMNNREELRRVGEKSKGIFIPWDITVNKYLDLYKEQIEKKKAELNKGNN